MMLSVIKARIHPHEWLFQSPITETTSRAAEATLRATTCAPIVGYRDHSSMLWTQPYPLSTHNAIHTDVLLECILGHHANLPTRNRSRLQMIGENSLYYTH